MSDPTAPETAAAQSARALASPLQNLLSNLPEIFMIGIAIWVLDVTAIFSFVSILHAGLVIGSALALIFSLPAFWASWQTLKLALFPAVVTVSSDD